LTNARSAYRPVDDRIQALKYEIIEVNSMPMILDETSLKRGDKIDLQFRLVTLFDRSELFLTFMFYDAVKTEHDIEKTRKEVYEMFESIRIK
jgi:hypothetical protein